MIGICCTLHPCSSNDSAVVNVKMETIAVFSDAGVGSVNIQEIRRMRSAHTFYVQQASPSVTNRRQKHSKRGDTIEAAAQLAVFHVSDSTFVFGRTEFNCNSDRNARLSIFAHFLRRANEFDFCVLLSESCRDCRFDVIEFLLREADCLAMFQLIVIELLKPTNPKLLTIRVSRELSQHTIFIGYPNEIELTRRKVSSDDLPICCDQCCLSVLCSAVSILWS